MANIKNCDIVIFGSGIVGLTLAASLAQRNVKVALIDRDSKEKLKAREEKRAFAIAQGSKEFLEEKSLWDFYKYSDICPIEKIHVIDGYDQNYLEFTQDSISQKNLGLMVSAKTIRDKISDHLEENHDNIDFYYEYKCENFKLAEDHVEISNGALTINTKLLIAVDGRNSFIRKKPKFKNIFS